jgi:hypothetical protein
MNVRTIESSRAEPSGSLFSRESLDLAAYAIPHFPTDRRACIAATAYETAERRGFEASHDVDDWLAAESEVDARLVGEGCAF